MIALGLLGFIVIHLGDIAALKRVPRAKPATWAIGVGLLVYATVMMSLSQAQLPLPVWSAYLGWPLLIISLFLLVYSLFINLPFRKTYVSTGVSHKLVTTGLYALVRHPWIHCFILVMLSLVLISRSSQLLIAAPIWILFDILLVVVQDRFLFGRMFKGYDDYQRKTPMFVPNRKSINAFISQLRSAIIR